MARRPLTQSECVPESPRRRERQYAALQRRNQAMKCLIIAVQELSLARNLDAVMEVVRRAARELTGADGATFVLRDGDQCFYAEENALAPLWKGQRFPMTACISGWTMLHGRPAVIENIYSDSRIPVEAYRPTFVKSLVMVPIRTDSPVGAIGNYWAKRHLATAAEVEVLQALANTTAVALELIEDIARRRSVEEELRDSEQKYRAIFENAVVGIFQTTLDGRYLSANRALAEMCGYDSPEQLMAEVTDVGRQLYSDPKRFEHLNEMLQEQGTLRNVESQILSRDGQKKWMLLNVQAVRGADGKIVCREGTVQDITELKDAEAQVQFLAYYDALTGLPNRTLFHDRLTKALANARRHKEKAALLFLDIDRFKTINDSLGHSIGDSLLKEFAERLKKWAREQDTVARLGGDEFVVLVAGVQDLGDAAVAADRLLKTMAAEFLLQRHLLTVTCSLGISVFPEHGTSGEALLKSADAAMYFAKEQGGNSFHFFTQEMNLRAIERLTLESSLRGALERGELFLEYQPQADIATGKITGVEALIRWRHPELGLVPPDKFISIAENSGLIIPIGEWVLKTACAQAREWQDRGLPPLSLAVNVSAVQFRQRNFLEVVRKVLEETGLPPQRLELELTESLLMSHADVTVFLLRQLESIGVKLALDDFGTGYSSLSYLRHFPIHKLKIDRSFVQAVSLNPDDAAIVATIISMAKSLNLGVIAEGVETEEQILFLQAHHCDEGQGYYFAKPLAAEEFTEKLRGTASLYSAKAAKAGDIK